MQPERLHTADLDHVELRACAHQLDAVARLDRAVLDADIDDHAEVTVVIRVEDEAFERRVFVARGRGNVTDDLIHDIADVQPGLRRHGGAALGNNADDILDLGAHLLHVGAGQIDLVDDRDDLQVCIHSEVGVCQRLCLDALRGVHHQQRAVAGVEAAGNLIVEVDMTGRVDQIERIDLAVLCGIIESDGARLDGDAALAFKIHVVEELLLHLARRDCARIFENTVGKGGLAVVDMGND